MMCNLIGYAIRCVFGLVTIRCILIGTMPIIIRFIFLGYRVREVQPGRRELHGLL